MFIVSISTSNLLHRFKHTQQSLLEARNIFEFALGLMRQTMCYHFEHQLFYSDCRCLMVVCLSWSDNLLLLQRFDFLCEVFNLLFECAIFSATPYDDGCWDTDDGNDNRE